MYKEIKDGLEAIRREQNTTQNNQADLKKNHVEFLEMKNKTQYGKWQIGHTERELVKWKIERNYSELNRIKEMAKKKVKRHETE